MKRSFLIIAALCLLLTLSAVACKNETPEPVVIPDVTAIPTQEPEAETTPELVTEPETPAPETPAPETAAPEVPADVTGAWYTNHYGIVQGMILNPDGTYEMTWEDSDIESIKGTWTFEDGTVVLDNSFLYEPMVPEGELLIWKDVFSDRIVYTREKPEAESPVQPTEPAELTAFLGVWQMDSVVDLASGMKLPAASFGIDLVLRIDEKEIVFNGEIYENTAVPYTFEDGMLHFTVADENGTQILSHLAAQEDGTLSMTMDGEDNAGVAYTYIPIK